MKTFDLCQRPSGNKPNVFLESPIYLKQEKKPPKGLVLGSRWWSGPELNWRHMDFQSFHAKDEKHPHLGRLLF